MMEFVNRDQSYILSLTNFLLETYGIKVLSLEPAKRGYHGETWKATSPEGAYFLKLDDSPEHQIIYRQSLSVVQYLYENGLDFIPKIILTISGQPYSYFRSAVLGVFMWVEGDLEETDATKQIEYELLSRLYRLNKPGFSIPTVKFSPEKAESFFLKWERLKKRTSDTKTATVLALLAEHEKELSRYAARLSDFSKRCQALIPSLYITHGDAGGNLIKGTHAYFIVDWDEVMYAPLERDAWVMACRPWAIQAFEGALQRQHIDYRLSHQCLAFYCYHMFFLYLGEFIDDFMTWGKDQDLRELFTGWMVDRLRYADSIE